MGKKTRRSKEKNQGDDVPPHLREFISSIGENWFPSVLKLLHFLIFCRQLWKKFRATRPLWSALRRTRGSRRKLPLMSLGRASDLWWPGWRYMIMLLITMILSLSFIFHRAINSLTWTSWTCGTASGSIFQKVQKQFILFDYSPFHYNQTFLKYSGQITRPQLMDIVTTVFPK